MGIVLQIFKMGEIAETLRLKDLEESTMFIIEMKYCKCVNNRYIIVMITDDYD